MGVYVCLFNERKMKSDSDMLGVLIYLCVCSMSSTN